MSDPSSPPVTSSDLAAGALLAGKYRIVRELGEGGMGRVFEGEHVQLGQPVAIKVLRDELVMDPSFVERFEREGRALVKLRSRHVVRVFDVGKTLSGAPFLVMEHLSGWDLDEELRRRGRLAVSDAVSYLRQACSAMAEAHRLGIIHRDLKPANLFLAQEGEHRIVKVLDFGIVKDALEGDVRLTQTATAMGTPLYMAPEQFRSAKNVDARADVWALGATLYELLAGQAPFVGTATTIGVSIVSDPVSPLSNSRNDVPPELEAVVNRALEKDPSRRYPTAKEMGEALAPLDLGNEFSAPSSQSFPLQSSREVNDMEVARTMPFGATEDRAEAMTQAFAPATEVARGAKVARPSRMPFVIGMLGGTALLAIGAFFLHSRKVTPETIDTKEESRPAASSVALSAASSVAIVPAPTATTAPAASASVMTVASANPVKIGVSASAKHGSVPAKSAAPQHPSANQPLFFPK